MAFSTLKLAQTVVQLCVDKGIEHIVISPGSRNSPLTITFSENNFFTCYSIVDERCAGFFGLGMAQQFKKPIALVCTSGSALLNYYPAIAEAFYSDIPMIVLSADRPKDLVEIGDGQTIRQENVYENHILYSANCMEGEEFQKYNETEINIALNSAIEISGPVHINLPFSEPLFDTIQKQTVSPQNVPPRQGYEKFSEDLSLFKKQWEESKRKIILVGVLDPKSLNTTYLKKLSTDPSVLILTESTSNLNHPNMISAIDAFIAPMEEKDFKELQPDILLTFGGMVVSKKIKAFLRKYPPFKHWHVNEKRAYDTYFSLDHHFKTDCNSFFAKFLNDKVKVNSNFQSHWLALRDYRRKKQLEYENRIPYSDFMVYAEIFRKMPAGMNLQLANSTAVRYGQLFPLPKSTNVFSNRGTSGIDGCTSTAIGAALASKRNTLLITGDLAFFYDSNALWNNYIPSNFKIIVVNNSGGGIFRILPGAGKTKYFETFIETQHNLTAENLCQMFDIEYALAQDGKLLDKQLSEFFKNTGPRLLEIFTPPEVNGEVLLNYFNYLK